MARKAEAAQNHATRSSMPPDLSPTSRITVCAIMSAKIPRTKNAARYPAASYNRSRSLRNLMPRSPPLPWERDGERVRAPGSLLERVHDRLPVRAGALHPVRGDGVADLLQVRLELGRRRSHGHAVLRERLHGRFRGV